MVSHSQNCSPIAIKGGMPLFPLKVVVSPFVNCGNLMIWTKLEWKLRSHTTLEKPVRRRTKRVQEAMYYRGDEGGP